MTVTSYSLLSAVMWSSVFIVLLYFMRKNTRLLAFFGATPLLLLGLGISLRCYFPLMFPHFTRLVQVKGVFTALCRQLERPLSPLPFTVGELLCVVWGLGSLTLALKEFLTYLRFARKLRSYEPLPDQQIALLAAEASRKCKTPTPQLIQTMRVMSPMIVGFLRPTILLPDFVYTDQEYRYIFLHEMTHWKNKDLWVKLGVEIYCICFWWNPLVYFMKKDLCRTLELKCDAEVLKDRSPEEAKAYQAVLVKTLVFSCGAAGIGCPLPSVGLISPQKQDLLQRVDLILRKRSRGILQKAALWSASFLMILLLALSYSIVLQPYNHPSLENFRVLCSDPAIEEDYPLFEKTYGIEFIEK